MNRRQTVVLWIAGIWFAILFMLFGLVNINSYSVENFAVNFLVFFFIFLSPFIIIFGLLTYTLRDKSK